MRLTQMESDSFVLRESCAANYGAAKIERERASKIKMRMIQTAQNWRIIAGRNNCPISRSPRYLSTKRSGRFRRLSRAAKNALLDGPILRTLLWLAWPNVIALSAGTCVVIAETSYIGRLGVELLAAMALVFPFVILTMTMSGGAMGGGVASAIARALGAGDVDRASALAAHAMLIGIGFGLTFTLGMLIFGPSLLALLGGRGNVLANAIGYAQIFFGGAVLPWLMNSMAGILRDRQHETAVADDPQFRRLQIILGGTLGLGLGPVPQFGMRASRRDR